MAIFHEFDLKNGTSVTFNINEVKYLIQTEDENGCEIHTKDGQEWALTETYKSVKKVLQK